MKTNKQIAIRKVSYSGLLLALVIVLGQLMRISFIPNTSIPFFVFPLFISAYILDWRYCFVVGFAGIF